MRSSCTPPCRFGPRYDDTRVIHHPGGRDHSVHALLPSIAQNSAFRAGSHRKPWTHDLVVAGVVETLPFRHQNELWCEAVKRSLITLKLLVFATTGGIIAAPTTSLPEAIGRHRNWDYRYCWLRDSALTLYALLNGGYREEAEAWRQWLLRAAAGHPEQLQIVYGVGGERWLPENDFHGCPAMRAAVRCGSATWPQINCSSMSMAR